MSRGFGFKPKAKTTATTAPKAPAPQAAPAPAFDQLPDSALLREANLVASPKRPGPALLPFSAATLWRKVRAGQFPAPTKLGERITCWKVGDVRRWLAAQEAANPVQPAQALSMLESQWKGA